MHIDDDMTASGEPRVDMTTSSVNLANPEVQADLLMTAKNIAASPWIEAVATTCVSKPS